MLNKIIEFIEIYIIKYIPVILFFAVLMLFINHLLRGLVVTPLIFLLTFTFCWACYND